MVVLCTLRESFLIFFKVSGKKLLGFFVQVIGELLVKNLEFGLL